MAAPPDPTPSVSPAAYPDDFEQRRALIPKVAKALSTWNDLTHKWAAAVGTGILLSKIDNPLQNQDYGARNVAWIEGKLWLSMTRALGMDATSSAGVSSTCSKSRNEAMNAPDCDDFLPTLCDSGRNVTPRTPPTEVAAEGDVTQHGPKPFRYPHYHSRQRRLGCSAGVSNKLSDRVKAASTHASVASLTHVRQKGAVRQQIDAPQNIIGQGELIHCSESTLSYQQDEHLDLLDNGFVYDSAHRSASCSTSRQIWADKELDLNTTTLLFTEDTDIDTPISTISEDSSIIGMNSSDPSQSLKDVMGDDMLLRPSTCTPGEDDAELLQNMFRDDPDMKFFSPVQENEMSDSDIMMLDSYDFSKKSINSSTSTAFDSHSSSAFEQLEQLYSYSYSSPVSSSSRTRPISISDNEGEHRHSPALRKISRPTRILEDNILIQRTSSSRKVETESRRSALVHSGR